MKKSVLRIFAGVIFVLLFMQSYLFAGDFKQSVRGVILDKDSKMPLTGASVVLVGSNPILGTTSDISGNFRLDGITSGRICLQVSFIGYNTITLSDLILSSSKELILTIEMEDKTSSAKEVTIIGNQEKDQINNKMTSVSARLFTIEETNRFAGSRGDPARMVMNYAGVSGANDQRNDVIIRGNSPTGILWRVEDVDVPNPNHFAAQGTSGGPVSILNNNTLRNSDFMSGAFPAEYSNALSGVFDLKMRNGNNEKHEYTIVSGFNGLEVGAEGPFIKSQKGSFMAYYRYSVMDLMDKIGLNMGTGGTPRYQDLTFKINVPLKKGNISVFGIGGTSDIAVLDSKKGETDLYAAGSGYDLYNGSDMATGAITYTRNLNTKSFIKFVLSGLYENARTRIDTLDIDKNPHFYFKENSYNYKTNASLILNSKLSSKTTVKSGISADMLAFDFNDKTYDYAIGGEKIIQQTKKEMGNGPMLIRGFNQWQYKFNDQLSVTPGLNFMLFTLNNKLSVEPKIGLSWEIAENHKLNLGYGMHSKMQPLYMYYYQTRVDSNTYVTTNENLDFTKAHHVVLGWDWRLSENLRLKTEAYYQYLYNVPIENISSSYSVLNNGAAWGIDIRDSLVNKGFGKNYGIELTLEKFFSKNYYFLFTASLFDSKYTGSDKVERNTAFNGKYVINGLLGKEIKWGENRAIILDLKATYAGGKFYTPIDTFATNHTVSEYETIYQENQAFTKQFPAYLKVDIKLGVRFNKKRLSQEFQVYLENITNNKNVLMQTYNRQKQTVENQ
ncbi:MAG: TonB-dependent receptor, partial [Bacteroidetes bacterium]|nr:TonB-dependent receptor [Bacteroidota bacterium]